MADPEAVVEATQSPVVARSNLVPPRLRDESIERTDLIGRVQSSPEQLVVVSGPAGMGKSTLLAQCHAAMTCSTWLSVGPEDNDPVHLWAALIESIGGVIDDFASGYRYRLVVAGPAVVDQIVTLVANELSDYGHPVNIFVDDLHLLEEPACRQSLHRLVDQTADPVGFFFATRGPDPIPLARRRVEGSVLEIDGSDLAMTLEESGRLLARLAPDLAPELLEPLVARTEGWPAGLQLAVMGRSESPDAAAWIDQFEGTDRFVADYLFSEVLAQLSAAEQRFLMETSILRSLSGDLCNAVTGRSDSARLLGRLEQANAFVIPLDRSGVWYRYHHLFAQMLESELRRRHPERVADLHSRAFEWRRDEGQIDDAINQGIAAGLVEEAAELLCVNWYDALNGGRLQSLRMWIERFDVDFISSFQPLAIAAAFVYGFAGDHRRARSFIEAAEAATYDGQPLDGTVTMASSLALTRGNLALDGLEAALADVQLAYDLEPEGGEWRPLAALVVGLVLAMRGELDRSRPYLDEAAGSTDAALRAYALAELSLIATALGEREEASAKAEAACKLVRDAGIEDLIMAGVAQAAAARSALTTGDTVAARASLSAATRPLDLVGQGLPMDALHAELLLAEVALDLAEYETAKRYIERGAEVTASIRDSGIMDQQLADLRARLEQAPPPTAPGPFESEDWSERELEVLQLLPAEPT